MLHVHYVKADYRSVYADVQLSYLSAKDVQAAVLFSNLLQLVQGSEDRWEVLVVDFLVQRKASFIDASIKVIAYLACYSINFALEFFQVQGYFCDILQ